MAPEWRILPTVSRRKWAAPRTVLARPLRSRVINTSPVPAAIALPQQNRYPTLMVASNIMLPESRIYVTAVMRTSMSIRRMMADFRHKSAIPNP